MAERPSFPPPPDIKRQQITQARESYRQKGYAAELDIEALKVQNAGDGESIEQQIASLEHTAANCYKAARRMDDLLKKLPAPKEPKPDKK